MQRELIRLQRQETISQLTAGVAHDFNNLLAVVNGSATLLAMDDDLSAALRGHVDRISAAGAQAAKLISRLLDIGATTEDEEVFELRSLISDLPNLVQASLPAHVDLHIDDRASALALRGSMGILNQILINLILNACDAFPAQAQRPGKIEIAVERHEATKNENLPVGALQAGTAYARIDVSDQGIGMEPAIAGQIFQPYFTTKGRQGTGLGLAMAAIQMRSIGGGITLDTAPGAGTTFSLYWPLAAERTSPIDLDMDGALIYQA